jgi:hypothetical protein
MMFRLGPLWVRNGPTRTGRSDRDHLPVDGEECAISDDERGWRLIRAGASRRRADGARDVSGRHDSATIGGQQAARAE